jgi:hypothetical protein
MVKKEVFECIRTGQKDIEKAQMHKNIASRTSLVE